MEGGGNDQWEQCRTDHTGKSAGWEKYSWWESSVGTGLQPAISHLGMSAASLEPGPTLIRKVLACVDCVKLSFSASLSNDGNATVKHEVGSEEGNKNWKRIMMIIRG